jgi:hypothetical protein
MGRAFQEGHFKITAGEAVLLPEYFDDVHTIRARRARKPGRQGAARG